MQLYHQGEKYKQRQQNMKYFITCTIVLTATTLSVFNKGRKWRITDLSFNTEESTEASI